jgi:hypothetical protein
MPLEIQSVTLDAAPFSDVVTASRKSSTLLNRLFFWPTLKIDLAVPTTALIKS